MEKKHRKLIDHLQTKLSSLDLYALKKCIKRNLEKSSNNVIKTHQNKLKVFTKNIHVPFTPDETIKNFSKYKLNNDEISILKYGLNHPIEPKFLSKTDTLTSFDLIHRSLSSDLKDESKSGELKATISNLANVYVSSYKPTKMALKKHGILKKLKLNHDIVITRPDKGSGVIILDRQFYKRKMKELVSDKRKFKKLNNDPTLLREGQLQRFLRKLKNKKFFNEEIYSKIYPTGSKPATIYGLPKVHKLKSNSDSDSLTFRPIVSSMVRTTTIFLNF